MSGVFISHASRDHRLASELGNLLARGLQLSDQQLFISTAPSTAIPPGEYWREVLRDKLEGADHVIALITPAWLDSRWCGSEGAIGWLRHKLIPVFYLPDRNAPKIFEDLQHLRLDDSSHLDRLADRLKTAGQNVSQASWGQQREAFLKFIASRPADQDDVTAAVVLARPRDGSHGVLVDVGHGQRSWDSDCPLFSRDGWVAAVGKRLTSVDVDLDFVERSESFTSPTLKAWTGFLLAMPASAGGEKPQLSPATLDGIVRWVRGGGRLALLGFELGDRHHGTNLNALADRFGLRFNTDIVAPEGWNRAHKPYGERVSFVVPAKQSEKKKALLQDLTSVDLRNVCTVSAEPGGRSLLPTGPLKVGWPQRHAVRYDGAGIMSVVGGEFRFSADPRGSVIAAAPKQLTGKGRVVGIGTWQLSAKLQRNLLFWLAKREA